MSRYLAAVWNCRYFWLSLVSMDLRTRYRRSLLGLGWSLLQPAAMTAVLCFVFHRVLHVDVRDYAPSLLTGLCFWGFFSATTLQGCQCLLHGERYIRQYPAPLAIYPLRTALAASFHLVMALIVVLAMRLCMAGFSGRAEAFEFLAALPNLASLVPTLAMIVVLGWSVATLASLATAYFPDVLHLAEVGLQVLFYATPIIYPAELLREKGVGWFVDLNPLAAFIELLRGPLVACQWPPAQAVALAAIFTAGCFATATWALCRLEHRIIFHL